MTTGNKTLALALAALLSAPAADAFASFAPPSKGSAARTTTALNNARRDGDGEEFADLLGRRAAGAGGAFLAGLGVAARLAFAVEPNVVVVPTLPDVEPNVARQRSAAQPEIPTLPSSLISAGAPGFGGGGSFDTLDFSLPSYSEATKGDISSSSGSGRGPPAFSGVPELKAPEADTEEKAAEDAKRAAEEARKAEEEAKQRAAEERKAAVEARKQQQKEMAEKAAKEAEERKAEEAARKAEEKAAAEKEKAEKKAAEEKAKAEAAEKKAAEEQAKAEEAERKAAEREKQRLAVERMRQKDAEEKEAAAPPAPAPAPPAPAPREEPSSGGPPAFSVPDIKVPSFSAPDISIPKFEAPKIDLPAPPKIDVPAPPKPSFTPLPDVAPPKFDVPTKSSSYDLDVGAPPPAAVVEDVEPQEVRDQRARDAKAVFRGLDAEAREIEQQARAARDKANVAKREFKAAKDEACKTRPGGKILCIRGFGSGF